MYFHNSLIPRGAYFLLPLESKQEATSGWNFTKYISQVKLNQFKVKNVHVKMGISTFKNVKLSANVIAEFEEWLTASIIPVGRSRRGVKTLFLDYRINYEKLCYLMRKNHNRNDLTMLTQCCESCDNALIYQFSSEYLPYWLTHSKLFSMVHIVERGITLFHLYSRNKSDKLTCLFFHDCVWFKMEIIVKCKGLQLSIPMLTVFVILSC